MRRRYCFNVTSAKDTYYVFHENITDIMEQNSEFFFYHTNLKELVSLRTIGVWHKGRIGDSPYTDISKNMVKPLFVWLNLPT